MISKNSLRNLLSRALASTVRRVGLRLKRRSAGIEQLETRALLAVFTVNSTNDDGAGSLRAAVASANGSPGADGIVFSPTTYVMVFNLTGGQLEISESITITGNGASRTVIDANQISRFFNVTSGNFTLNSVRLRNGRTTGAGDAGGAISSSTSGQLTIHKSVLSGNSTTGGNGYGGAIFTSAGAGAVTISQSTLSGNSTTGSRARGGGIFASSGAVTLANSTVLGNSTAGNNADGGGIFASSGAVTLTNSTASGNSTAGIYANGGGISASSGAVTLTNSTVSGNSTTGWTSGYGTAGNNADGGGIFASSGAVTLTNSTVSGNSTAGNNANGGGISASSGAVTLTNSTVSGNSTTGSSAWGGGIFVGRGAVTLTNSTVSENSTASYNAIGGGIFADRGAVTLTNSTVSENSTASYFADGGGIFAHSGAVTLIGSTVSGNSTAGNAADGGGIRTYSGAVTLTNSTVSGNSTAGNFAKGGGIYARTGAVTLTGSTVSGNQVTGINSEGGGVFLDDSVVTIVNSTVTGNSASRVGGGLGVLAYGLDKKLTIHNSIIAGNTAASDPDFTAPANPATNLEVRHSLIGRSDGTTLTATAGTTPGANGNLIGGNTIATRIVPGLGSLANNGGPTQTHALLINSPAFNRGSNALAAGLTDDQRGAGFARTRFGIVDIGALESAVLDSPEGTTGDDAFVLTYSSTTTTGTVTVTVSSTGGPVVTVGTFPMNSPLTINGLGGTDSVRIVGTAGADTISVNSSTSLTVNGASLILTSIENRTLAGAAGSDVYRFDVDSVLGLWTLAESGVGIDTVDFSPTTTVGLVLNLATSGTQPVHATNLSLILGSAATIENATGGAGADTLFGNGLSNTLTGGAGDDRLIGAGGSDLLFGGANNDRYDFFPTTVAEADQVTENANEGIDTLNFAFLTTSVVVNLATTSIQPVHANRTLKLNSASVLENLVGGSGADRLFGNSLDNNLTAGAGDDKLIGAGGNDLMLGGADNDTYVFVPTTVAEADTVRENLNQGTDTLSFAFLTTNIVVNLGSTSIQPVHLNRTLKLNSATAFENLMGGSGADTLFGNGLDNTLSGNVGNDKLLGAGGNDVLRGGINNDTYMFVPTSTAEADHVIENANEGIDTLSFAYLTTSVVVNLDSTSIQPVNLNRTLRLNSVSTFENAVGGTASDMLMGNAVANRLTGGNGHNILVGMEGGDILEAGRGRDILIGGLGLDILKGDAGDDILIAGRTTNDASLSNLNTLRTQWISANAYTTRVTNLRAGVGSPLVSLKATINVLNDAGEDDVLFGGTDTDWFFRAVDDVIADLFAGELIDVL